MDEKEFIMMDTSDFKKASGFWTDKEKTLHRMDREKLFAEAEKFIKAHTTCALATGAGDFVRCTPIEYNYADGMFYLFSEGGMKFCALEKNRSVCMAIFDQYSGVESLNGMQVSGTASFVEPFSEEYLKLLSVKGIPAGALKSLPYTMYLIKVRPLRIDFLSSSFKQQGYDSRQFIEF